MRKGSPIHTRLCAAALLTLACGGSSGSSADASSGEASSTDGGHTSTTGTDDWPYDHGYIKVNVVLDESAPDGSLLEQTDRLLIAMDYGDCLQAYYETHPEAQQYGEAGPGIFGDASQDGEGWLDLLCSPLFGDHAPCSTVFVTQRFDTIRNLTVTYESLADIGTMPLLFGPIPTAETAGCAAGLEPTMEIIDTTLVRGLDEAEFELWEGQAAVPAAIASRDPDPVVVTVVPYEGD